MSSSRIARDNLLSAEFYALMEQHPEIAVALAEGYFDRSPDGELNWTVQQAAATHLRKMTGRKIKSAYKHLNQAGAATGQAPYGYRREGKGGPLVIDEEQAAVVRDLFEEYAAGRFSARLLAARLNAQGWLSQARAPAAWAGARHCDRSPPERGLHRLHLLPQPGPPRGRVDPCPVVADRWPRPLRAGPGGSTPQSAWWFC